jgi:probable F420-dependent oxidoreductase
MKFGLFTFPLRMEQIRAVAVEAEGLGFDSIWLGEHLIAPVSYESSYPHGKAGVPKEEQFHPGIPFFDPYIVFGHLAALTETIKFGIGVSVLPLHDPYHLARSIMTLDQLAPERFLLGIGTGWLREEFDIVGKPFRGRGARLDETLDVMERLWRDDVASYDGAVFRLPASRFEPKPHAPKPPYVFGGHSDVALRRTAARGEGWIGVEVTPEELSDLVGRLRSFRRAEGSSSDVEVTVLLWQTESGLDVEDVGALERLSPELIERYAEAGADRLVIRPWRKGRNAVANTRRAATTLGLVG